MADWTELLPEGVQNPIVVEIRHAPGMLPAEAVGRAIAEVRRLANDREWLDSKSKLLQELGADHLTVLAYPAAEHWRAAEGEPGQPDRKPGPPSHDVAISVHLPATLAATPEDEERVTRAVMDWFESSKLGRSLLREARRARVAHIGARGVRYGHKGDLAHIPVGLQDLRDQNY